MEALFIELLSLIKLILVTHWYISVPVIILLVILAIVGKFKIDWANKKFSFGSPSEKEQEKQDDDHKRTCTDCIMLILGKRTVFESQYHTMQNKILREQMTYAEHKLQEAKFLLLQEYQRDIEYFRKDNIDLVRENKEYLIYQEIISNALLDAKDEVRRSMKENGFHELDISEFKMYIDEREQNLITIVRDYMRRTYPISGMIVSLQDRFKRMDNGNIFQIQEIITDIYTSAKNTRIKIEQEMVELQNNFANDIDNLIGEKHA